MIFQPERIRLIYASASGNTFDTAKYVKDYLLAKGFDASLHRAEIFEIEGFNDNDLFIFAVSTWEHGEINPHFNDLLNHFERNENDIKAAFIGLGDLRYEPILFCAGMQKLRDAVLNGGGQEIVTPVRINGDPHESFDTVVDNWIRSLTDNLKK